MAKILIVDDDPGCRTALRTALEAMHHEVHEAKDGYDGIRACVSLMPELVLLDVLMPEKDGIETMLELRSLERGLPVVLMSDGGSIGIDRHFHGLVLLGARGALKKPFGREELARAIDTALAAPTGANPRG